MTGERTRLQAVQAERVAAPVRREALGAIGRTDPEVRVEWLAGPAARDATDGLLGRLGSEWWGTREALARRVDPAEAVAAAASWLASRGGVAVVLGSTPDVGPLAFPRGLAAPVLETLLTVDGEEVWLFPAGDEALLVETAGDEDARRVDVWVVACAGRTTASRRPGDEC